MTTVAVAFLALSLGLLQQSASGPTSVSSSGPCSPNIPGNQGNVQFTCNTPIDKPTADKIVVLLNRILQRKDTSDDTNRKLDTILEFLRTQAERTQQLGSSVDQLQRAREPRRLTEPQKTALTQAISDTPGQVVHLLRVPNDSEVEGLHDQFVEVFRKAGWNLKDDLIAVVGLPGATGLGVVIHSQQEHPKAADHLLIFLKKAGFKVEGVVSAEVPPTEVRVVIALKE